MKPASKRGVWRTETALRRVRRCLGLLRLGDFVSVKEQAKISERIAKWKKKQPLRKLVKGPLPTVEPKPTALRNTIEERFRAFHAANPAVYRCLIKLTQERFLRGSQRHGMKAMWEQLRYRIATGSVRLAEGYNFNNDYTSRYARLLVEQYPAYRGLFELRQLSAL
jgi:hypothetical protein